MRGQQRLATPVTPLLAVAFETKIMSRNPELRANRPRVFDKALRRLRVATNCRALSTENTRFLETDGLACITEITHMIQRHARDDRAVGIDDVDRVEPSAQPDFENDDIEPRHAEHLPGR